MRARSVCPSVPYACFLRGGPPVSGTSSVGLGAPRQTHMLPTLDHPKRARSGHMRGDPATRTARGAALDPVPYRPRARGRAFRQPLCLVSTDALQSRCPASPAAGRTRPPGGRKASRHPPNLRGPTGKSVVGWRGPHRTRFGHLPRELVAPRSPLRPRFRPAAAGALHRDALAAQAHCLDRRAAPHRAGPAHARTRPRPCTACTRNVFNGSHHSTHA